MQSNSQLQQPQCQFQCSNKRPALMVCVRPSCTTHPFMCDDEECSCQQPHETHSQQKMRGLLKLLKDQPKVDTEVSTAIAAMTKIIDDAIHELTELKARHKKLADQFIARECGGTTAAEILRSGHLNEQIKLTGDMLSKMMVTIEQGTKPTRNPYMNNHKVLEQETASTIKHKVAALTKDIEDLWNLGVKPKEGTAHTLLPNISSGGVFGYGNVGAATSIFGAFPSK